MPVPMNARSKAWVCGCSPAEIVGSNPTGGMDVMSVVSVVLCTHASQVTICSQNTDNVLYGLYLSTFNQVFNF